MTVELCECGLPWQLCSMLGFIDIMLTAALRGEIHNAQHAAAQALEVLDL